MFSIIKNKKGGDHKGNRRFPLTKHTIVMFSIIKNKKGGGRRGNRRFPYNKPEKDRFCKKGIKRNKVYKYSIFTV